MKDKVALVTGSTGGIGFSIAQALAEEGARVYVNGRSSQKVEEAKSKMKSIKGELLSAPFDLEDKKGIDALINAIPSLDILVNNLGIYEPRPFEEITDEEWMRIFNINVLTGIRLSRHYFPLMKKKNWGRIVFISSESAINTPPEMIHYGMTKTAQLAIARGLAEMTAGTKITVNSVLPGPTYSSGVEKFISQVIKRKNLSYEEIEKEFFTSVRPASLIKRFIACDEVGAFVAFICSEQAGAINGATLRIDGGIVHSII